MRLFVPFASVVSAIRCQITRTMSSSNNNVHDDSIRSFLKEVYQKKTSRNVFSVFVSGGGCTALEWLFTVPGASNSLMDAGVVYSRPALNAFIQNSKIVNQLSVSACSSATALAMADASWRHANEFLLESTRDFNSVRDVNIFGLSCTASLASDVPKKGAHRVFVASTMQETSKVFTVEFQKGLRTRKLEDAACSRLILDAIAKCSGIAPLPLDYLYGDGVDGDSGHERNADIETIKMSVVERSDILDRACRREIKQALFIKRSPELISTDNSRQNIHDHFVVLEDVPLPKGTLVFPGSFNPLHEGHIALVVAALQKIAESSPSWSSRADSTNFTGSESDNDGTSNDDNHSNWRRIPVVFEIAAINADKPPLPRDEIMRRIMQFDLFLNPLLRAAGLTNIAVCVTSEPFFLQKSGLFSGCNFLIGSDTMSRIIDPKYYGPKAPTPQSMSGVPSVATIKEKEEEHLRSVCTMVAALTTIAERGCHFVVGGRVSSSSEISSNSQFETFRSVCEKSDVDIPYSLLHSLFEGLSEEEFRLDLSSTQLRNKS